MSSINFNTIMSLRSHPTRSLAASPVRRSLCAPRQRLPQLQRPVRRTLVLSQESEEDEQCPFEPAKPIVLKHKRNTKSLLLRDFSTANLVKVRKSSFQSASTNESTQSSEEHPQPDFVTEYGAQLQTSLRLGEVKLKANHLEAHEIKASYRAKMVDWMCEVIGIAFKHTCTD